jgi:DNA-binding response OmpR family regulator
MRILIIEDNRVIQAGLRRALAKAGHEVSVCGDGQLGLKDARETIPHLILLDMMLPTISGLSVLSALKAEAATKDIPVFVLSGLSKTNESKLLEAGATKYFEKSDSFLDCGFAALVEEVGKFQAKRA